MSALEAALNAHWAMLPEAIERLVEIADRGGDTSPEALEAYRSTAAERGEQLQIRDNVAILDISGPLFKRANLMTKYSGAKSYETLRRDLQVALDDPSIDGILLKIDTPGGEANGADELASAIYAAREKKRIVAYVSGQAASAGYWLASAAHEIVASDGAMLGSIGVVLSITDRRKAEERNGVSRLEFVSSQSPGKRPDPMTDEGKERIQRLVNDLADVFVSAVAKYRGVSAEDVVSKFGAGGVEIGAKAVALGMADRVGQFEETLAALSKRGPRRTPQRSFGGILMSEQQNAAVEAPKVDVAAIQAEAVAAAQARIKAIQTSEDGKLRPNLANHLAFETAMSVDAALGILKVAAVEAKSEPQKEKSFEERKAEAGALGLAAPESRNDTPAHAVGWQKAAERANARFGKDAV